MLKKRTQTAKADLTLKNHCGSKAEYKRQRCLYHGHLRIIRYSAVSLMNVFPRRFSGTLRVHAHAIFIVTDGQMRDRNAAGAILLIRRKIDGGFFSIVPS